MHYAINLYNLMNLKELDPIGALLFPPNILGEAIIPERRRLGTDAIILNCNQERAEAIVKLVRKKYKKHQFIFHKSKTGKGSWKRI